MIDSTIAKEIHSANEEEPEQAAEKYHRSFRLNLFMVQIAVAAVIVGAVFVCREIMPGEFNKLSDIYRKYMYDSLYVDDLPDGVKIIETLGR